MVGHNPYATSGLTYVLFAVAGLLLVILALFVFLAFARTIASQACIDAGGELVYGARFAPWQFWCSVPLGG